jgi:murein DD-endopeptidase MepM/ murein hydrolase activator NlpD
MKILKIILFLSLTNIVLAQPILVKTSNVPGGIVIKNVPCDCKAYFSHHRVMILNKNQQCFAIVGIPLTTTSGQHNLTIKEHGTKTTLPINIIDKKYPTKYLTIKRKKTGIPNKELIARLKREAREVRNTFKYWSNKNYINLRFNIPVKGRISSPFGAQRIINKTRKTRHRGIDIAAITGTPIKAPANGKVINEGNYLLLGKAVFIDHGQNLITVYCHLNKILVKTNQWVKRGQIIGHVGNTGRSTGSHLHWGVSLNGTRVNPLLFINNRKI